MSFIIFITFLIEVKTTQIQRSRWNLQWFYFRWHYFLRWKSSKVFFFSFQNSMIWLLLPFFLIFNIFLYFKSFLFENIVISAILQPVPEKMVIKKMAKILSYQWNCLKCKYFFLQKYWRHYIHNPIKSLMNYSQKWRSSIHFLIKINY